VQGKVEGSAATVKVQNVVGWGVETTLDKEMMDLRPGATRIAVDDLVVQGEGQNLRFEVPRGAGRRIEAWVSALRGAVGRWIGRNSFVSMFGTALIVGFVPTYLLEWGVVRRPRLAELVVNHYAWVVVGVLAFELAVLSRLFTRELPTWMDNAYRHRNRADNLRSLRRSAGPA
jgi:hypothetical protein